jgi:peptide/nickel transport system substrate-binding protein
MAGPPEGHDPPDQEQHILIRTFLIADIRGYTLFTQERGDEAAAKLTAKFAGVVREAVEARGGSLIELRGDEALAVFASARQAIRTAVELQGRFVEETLADPTLPLTVGIGLDAGEAVPTEEGYRGGALNLAARLCGEAGPGECLASNEAVHLARKVEGVRYVDRGELHLKGLSAPVRVAAVRPETDDPARRLATLVPSRTPPKGWARWSTSQRVAVALLAVAVLVAAVLVPMALLSGDFPGIAENSVGLIDVESGDLQGTVNLKARPGDITRGAGAIWVTIPDEGRIVRIDPVRGSVADSIPVGGAPGAIAVGDGAVWVADSAGRSVSKVSPATGAPVQALAVGGGPLGVAFGYGSLWVSNGSDDTVSRLDPVSGDELESFEVGDRPGTVVVGAGAVWVANSAGGSVSKIDPSTNAVVADIPVGNGPADIHVGEAGVWVANRLDATVSRIDPQTNEEQARIPVADGPGAVTRVRGSVWVSSEFEGRLSRIDPATSAVTESFSVGNAPSGLVALGGDLWVPVGPAAQSHRGGTLRVTRRSKDGIGSIDPAFGYTPLSWEVFPITHDGLVGFRRTGGPDGTTLVPDLARSLPQPTDGGTTYAFQLREGVQYSTGEAVRSEDFRWAIERGLRDTTGDATASIFFGGIVGAEGCVEDPDACDLSRGVVTAGDSIVFHLRQPDPDFLYKLAMPPAFAVPQEAPLEDTGTKPIPGTGPYRISRYVPPTLLELARNPHFEEWSAAAQPAGVADQVQVRYGAGQEDQIRGVLEGDVDLALSYDPLTGERVDELQARFPGRILSTLRLSTFYMALNPHTPPFDDERVRRALNFAVDRGVVADMYGGAPTTCQMIPPNVAGYERYCPYTRDPTEDQEWSAPDPAMADRLVRASGTEGMEVTVWTSPEIAGGMEAGRYFVSLLDGLGYRAKLRTIGPFMKYFGYISDPRNEVQIGLVGYFADYPAASSFLIANLSCNEYNNNLRFCEPELDQLTLRASRLQLTDPPAARDLLALAERRYVDLAPAVFLAHPAFQDFVAERVGNVQQHPVWGPLLSQVWVQ